MAGAWHRPCLVKPLPFGLQLFAELRPGDLLADPPATRRARRSRPGRSRGVARPPATPSPRSPRRGCSRPARWYVEAEIVTFFYGSKTTMSAPEPTVIVPLRGTDRTVSPGSSRAARPSGSARSVRHARRTRGSSATGSRAQRISAFDFRLTCTSSNLHRVWSRLCRATAPGVATERRFELPLRHPISRRST
jgi:hypothetical protein